MNVLCALKRLLQTKNVELVHSLTMCEKGRSLLARQLGTSFGAVQSSLTDILGMSKVSVRWVSRMLTKDQRRPDIS